MQTITFYSYKGGAGRTLLLANVAQYLSRFRQKVFVVDFDLEAPGLHYKLSLDQTGSEQVIKKGVIDYIHSFSVDSKDPGMIADYALRVAQADVNGGAIHMMPAGDVSASSYWRRLARINWHELFYSEAAQGIPFFIDFKARIQEAFDPDFLLIDSRTGITEVGGVATTILPDAVVCLLQSNRENRDGAREVLRGIHRAVRLRGQDPIRVIPVLTRIPVWEKPEDEANFVAQVRNFLNEPAMDLADTLIVNDLPVLHTDRAVEMEETVLLEGVRSIDQSPLLRDYVRLFAQLVDPSVLEPNIGPLVDDAVAHLLDDPDRTERDLLALAEYYTHPSPYRALLQYYRLRNASPDNIFSTARRYWEISGRADDKLLWSILKENQDAITRIGMRKSTLSLDLAYAVWRTAGSSELQYGVRLALAFDANNRGAEAQTIVHSLVTHDNIDAVSLVGILGLLRRGKGWDTAFDLIDRFQNKMGAERTFIQSWLDLTVASGSEKHALALLHHLGGEVPDWLMMDDPVSAFAFLEAVGESDVVRGWLTDGRLDFNRYNPRMVSSLWRAAERFGLVSEFEGRLRSDVGSAMAEQLLAEVRGEQVRLRRSF